MEKSDKIRNSFFKRELTSGGGDGGGEGVRGWFIQDPTPKWMGKIAKGTIRLTIL